MGDRYKEESHKIETDFPLVSIAGDIHEVKVTDTKTGRTERGSGWSHEEAKRDAIKKLGGKG
jgi:hypothetical protein